MSYEIGDIVKYKDSYYYVIDDSDSNKNYVTLLKDVPLTIQELKKYGSDKNGVLFVNKNVLNGKDPEEKIFDLGDNIGGILYYSSDTCRADYRWNVSNYISDNYITTGCKNSFETSDVKKVLDNWIEDFKDDLVEVDNYKVRLITTDELVDKFYYSFYGLTTDFVYETTNQTPNWIHSYVYWTMIPFDDSMDKQLYVNSGKVLISTINFSSVRPVINLYKCVLEDGCLYEEEYICLDKINEDYNDNIDDNDLMGKVVVTVANTLKHLPKIVIFISITLIIIGLSILGYNYYKSKNK